MDPSQKRGFVRLRFLLILFVAGVVWALYAGYLKWTGPTLRVQPAKVEIKK